MLDPIYMNPVSESYPLSPMQKGMLVESLSSSQGGVNIEQMIIELREELDPDLLTQAWKQTINQHPILRTQFRWHGLSEPVQEVVQEVDIVINQIDWRILNAERPTEQLLEFLRLDRSQGFQLDQAPLMRWTLIRTNKTQYWLIWTFFHGILDGRSFAKVLNQVFIVYESLRRGLYYHFPPSPPFREYIEWLEHQDLSLSKRYWVDALSGFSVPLALDFNLEGESTVEKPQCHQEVRREFSPAFTEKLKSWADQNEITVNTVVLGAWSYLLHRYTGEREITFGITRNCPAPRLEQEEELIGIFINTLPLRVLIDPEETPVALLQKIRRQWVEMREHAHVPISLIREWNDISSDSPLFETLVVFENRSLNTWLRRQNPAWENRTVALYEQASFPLTLAGYLDEKLEFTLEYDPQRFSPSLAARILDNLETIITGMVDNPPLKVAAIPLLSTAEEKRLLVDLNQTGSEYPRGVCIHHLIEAAVRNYPNSLAVSCENHELTYREFNRQANQLAHYLIRLGVKPNMRIGLFVQRSWEMAVGILGIIKSGGAYVPLDPNFPPETLAFMMENAEIPILVTQASCVRHLPASINQIVLLDQDWRHIAVESPENPSTTVTAEDAAIIMYTSGSTGDPKGVVVSHRSFVNYHYATARFFALSPQDRVMQYSTITFDMASHEIFPTWVSGATLVICREGMLTSTVNFMNFLTEQRITVVHLITNLWHQWIRNLHTQKISLPKSLRLVTVGGEEVSWTVYSLWQELNQKRVRWVNVYGPAETTVGSTMYDPWIHGEYANKIPIGKAIANTQVYIVDEDLRLVPEGVSGELLIGGDGVAQGYVKDATLTEQKFIPHPFSTVPGKRVFKTGDRGRYLPDGNLEYLGRLDRYIKIRGFRIDLNYLENRLRNYPEIQDAVVLDRKDEREETYLTAYIIPADPKSFNLQAWKEKLRKDLPHHVIPPQIKSLAEFPKTATGKIDKSALLALDSMEGGTESISEAPFSLLAGALIDIWTEVLGVDSVSIRDDFFDLGGDSLYMIQIMDRCQMAGIPVNPEWFYQYRTIHEWIDQIEKVSLEPTKQTTAASAFYLRRGGNKLPLFFVPGYSGTMFVYGNIIYHLEPDRSCLGFHSLDFYLKQAKPPQIEQLAAYYLQQLFQVDPHGPYMLAGLCFGGVVAFEMAQQLLRQGKKISFLGLMETMVLPPRNLLHPYFRQCLWELLRFHTPYWKPWLTDTLIHIGHQFSLVKPDPSPLILRTHPTENHFSLKIFKYIEQMNFRSVRNYHYQNYPGKVTIFYVKNHAVDAYPCFLGWSTLVEKLDLYEIPGDHADFYRGANAETLAHLLTDCIHKAENQD